MKRDKSALRYLAMLTHFGINMIVPIFLCSFLGMFLDRRLGTSFCMIILFFLGAAAGFRNIYILAMQSAKRDQWKERHHAHKRKETTDDR